MPHPVYIICCESGAEDRLTNVLSYFNVIEKFLVWKGSEEKKVQIPDVDLALTVQRMRVMSVWMKSEDDSEDAEFEYRVEMIPPNEQPEVVSDGKFRFIKPLHRLQVSFIGKPNVKHPGVLWIESRVRRIGTEEWISQRYPIIVEFKIN